MTLRRVPAALAAVIYAVPAWSQFTVQQVDAALKNPGHYTLDESTLKVERVGPSASPAAIEPPASAQDAGSAVALDSIVNLGRELWRIIVENRPVVDVCNEYATALPKGISSWAELETWQPPKGAVYRLTAKNIYGVKVVDVRYQILRTWGGSYRGKGRYLTAVAVEPLIDGIDVAWGYHFTMESAVPASSVVNAGSSEDPVAALNMRLAWRISTPVKDSQGVGVYYVRGDGEFREIGGSVPAAARQRARAGAVGALAAVAFE